MASFRSRVRTRCDQCFQFVRKLCSKNEEKYDGERLRKKRAVQQVKFTTRCQGKIARLICLVMMIGSGVIAITGSGVIVILEGILGVLFAMEGFWGVARQDPKAVKRFLQFMFVFMCISVGVGIIGLQTKDEYCTIDVADAEAKKKLEKDCNGFADIFYFFLIFGSIVFLLPAEGIVFYFYRTIVKEEEERRQVSFRDSRKPPL